MTDMKNFLKKFAKNLLLVLKYTGVGVLCLFVGFGTFACLRALLVWLYHFVIWGWPIILTVAILFILFALGLSILGDDGDERYA